MTTPTRAAYLLSNHRIIIGETRCPGCDSIHTNTKTAVATCECGRPWDRICGGWSHHGQHHECAGTGWAVVPPKAGDHWASFPRCAPCATAPMRQQLTDRIPEVFPGLGAKIAQARDYRYLDHRATLDTALHDQDRNLLLVWGPCGSGKTVSVLRWAMDQHLDGRDVLWVSSHDLVHLFKRVLPDTEASTLWSRLRSARVVVVDDFQGFHCRDWTDNVAAEMGFLLQGFMDRAGARAVLISNRDPAEILRSGGELGDRTRSRFNEQGRAVACFGKDMRMGR